MRTEQELRQRIAEIKADDRMAPPRATVFENAPLALIQLEGETAIAAIEWVLGERKRCAGSYRTNLKS